MALSRADLIQATLRAITTHQTAYSGGDSTGLGWSAKKEFLVYDAGTIATADSGQRTPYIKLYDGYAVGAYTINGTTPGFGNDWVGIHLFSTDPTYVGMQLHTERDWYECRLFSFEYLNLTWYWTAFNQNSRWSGANSLNTSLPVFDATGYTVGISTWGVQPPTDVAVAILEAAGVSLINQIAYTKPVYAVPRLIPPED